MDSDLMTIELTFLSSSYIFYSQSMKTFLYQLRYFPSNLKESENLTIFGNKKKILEHVQLNINNIFRFS